MGLFLCLLVCSFRCLLTSKSSLFKWRKRIIRSTIQNRKRLQSRQLLELQLYSDLSLLVKRFVLVCYFFLLHKWLSPPQDSCWVISNTVVRNSNRAVDHGKRKKVVASRLCCSFSFPSFCSRFHFPSSQASYGTKRPLRRRESHKWSTCF